MTTYSSAVSGVKVDAGSWALSNSDQPGMALVTAPLLGTNFISWSLAVKTALEAKDKLGFIDGTIKEPTDESDYKKWKPVDSMLRQELASLRQRGDSVTDYYNKIHRYWDELHRLRPTPRCVCAKCTCNFKKKLDELEADTRLVQFLMGLSQNFEVIRSQILSLDPLPSVNKAFSLVVNVETEKETNSSQGSSMVEASAMLAKTNNRSETSRRLEEKRNDKMTKFCDHCQQNGHTRDACFKIIGYPEWFKELKEQRNKNGRKGNTANMVIETPIDMTKDKDTYDYASVMNALQELTKIVKGKADEHHVNFSNLGEFAGKSGKDEYTSLTDTSSVVDTGASSHMCFNNTSLTDTSSVLVHLPDGTMQRVKHMGRPEN
ncbi:uncharacterized protein G2W53_025874 [Senna tora]|uniref:Retrotransposon Copia-like N-terminal domain-containing protein n=1 Tax=Senna tora TaxID=362788 RepID=A0A834TGB8_9FABA|nr:uncharacterized protein G2W53_025874 [Senna tora]